MQPLAPYNAPHILAKPYAPGDRVPWFRTACDSNPDFDFSTLAGHRVLLCCLGSLIEPAHARLAQQLMKTPLHGGDLKLALLTQDIRDAQNRLTLEDPDAYLFFDFDRRVSQAFGLIPDPSSSAYAATTFVLSRGLQVEAVVPVRNASSHYADLVQHLRLHTPPEMPFRIPQHAPVLHVPHVLPADICGDLIKAYTQYGGKDSGYAVERAGHSVFEIDHTHKNRKDWLITDERWLRDVRRLVLRRVVPEVQKAFQFEATRMERYLVACYDAADQAHFALHRDNATRATAHRRFSISLNLNDNYEGGELSFAEYSAARYKPEAGHACVFSSTLLHKVEAVTQGQRYALLPFLYDEAAAKLRDRYAAYTKVPESA